MKYSSVGIIILTVYVDIIITGDGHQGFIRLKTYLSPYFI